MKRCSLLVAILLALALPTPALASPLRVTPHAGRRTVRAEARRPRVEPRGRVHVRQIALDAEYRSASDGIAVRYPSTWQLTDHPESAPPLTLVALFLSPQTHPGDIRQNVNLVIEHLASPLSLAEYSELGIATEREFFDDYTLISSAPARLAGVWAAHRVQFGASHDGMPMTFVQIWTLRGSRAYVWTFADHSDTFAEHLPVFERMLDSVRME